MLQVQKKKAGKKVHSAFPIKYFESVQIQNTYLQINKNRRSVVFSVFNSESTKTFYIRENRITP